VIIFKILYKKLLWDLPIGYIILSNLSPDLRATSTMVDSDNHVVCSKLATAGLLVQAVRTCPIKKGFGVDIYIIIWR